MSPGKTDRNADASCLPTPDGNTLSAANLALVGLYFVKHDAESENVAVRQRGTENPVDFDALQRSMNAIRSERHAQRTVDCDNTEQEEISMLKIAALAGTLALAMTGASFAQSTGPSGQSTTSPGATTPGAMNNPNAMAPSGTTSGSGSSATGTTGSANGSATSTQKGMTGPSGASTKSETPAR